MTILILHGISGHAGIHWQWWLHDELIKLGHIVIMPTLPNPNHPKRQAWLKTIQDLTKEVKLFQLIIIGHSLGVPAALDFLETIDKKIKALICVAGFFEDYGSKLNCYYMKDKNINMKKVKDNVENIYVLYGKGDPYVPQEILQSLADTLNVKPDIFPEGGHLNTSTGFTTFPEILNIINKLQ